MDGLFDPSMFDPSTFGMAEFANPNPVMPGQIPMPVRPPPELAATPEMIAAANGGAGAVPGGLPRPDAPMAFAGGPSVGEALTGTPSEAPPLPQGPTPSGATLDEASQGQGAMAQAPGGRPRLAQALKGVTAPAAPVQQKISSPNAPRPTGNIKGGELMALLAALNAGGGMKGPPKLGG